MEEDNGNDIVIAYSDELVVFEDRKLSMFAPHAVEAFDVGSGAARLDVFDLDQFDLPGLPGTAIGRAPAGAGVAVDGVTGEVVPGLFFAAGLGRAMFSDVDPNPTEMNAEAGIKVYRDGGHDGVIAFGGGSGLDAAKAVALRKVVRLLRIVAPMSPLLGLWNGSRVPKT